MVSNSEFASVLEAFLASIAHRVRGVSAFLFALDDFVLGVLLARRAVFLSGFWKLQGVLGRGGV